MKLPRWLVTGMLTSSVLAVLAAAGWWWVTWPERTVSSFLEFVSIGDDVNAAQLLTPELAKAMKVEKQYCALVNEYQSEGGGNDAHDRRTVLVAVTESELRFESRSWIDLLTGQLVCTHYSAGCILLDFTVKRSTIVDIGVDYPYGVSQRIPFVDFDERYRGFVEARRVDGIEQRRSKR